MQSFDVIVIGVGGVGSAAAMHLARRGVKVLALDRFAPGHDRGSSHGQTRIIRMAYFEHPDYVPLLRRAYELWAELEQTIAEKLYHEVGVLQVGPPDGAVIAGVRQSAQLHQLPLESIARSECARRFPGFYLDERHDAVFEKRAGYLRVERAVIGHASEASRLGAIVKCDATVRSWKADAKGVRVETEHETFTADRLVITAGAWAGPMLADLGLPLRVLRKPLYWFAPAGDEYREQAGSPCFLYDLPHGCFYGFPQIDDRGVKMAEHTGGEPVSDPLQLNRELDEPGCQRVADFVQHNLIRMTTQRLDHATCMYTMSPDEHFIVGRHPKHPQVVFAAGLSGHGFKFTSVLGEALCELALDGKTRLPMSFLALQRFSSKTSGPSIH